MDWATDVVDGMKMILRRLAVGFGSGWPWVIGS